MLLINHLLSWFFCIILSLYVTYGNTKERKETMSNTNKTVYQFNVNASEETVNQVFQSWLAANGFSFQPKEGANYYYFNDPMVKGKRSLEYYIHGAQVTIVAYLGTFEKPKALEGFVGALPKQMYKDDLSSLFKALEQMNAYGVQQAAPDVAAPQGYAPQPMSQPVQQVAQSFVAENEKKKETMVIIGFIMSIFVLLLSCFGAYAILLVILEFYFAIQGLKTKKKGLAIATIVLASLSIVFCLFAIVLTVLLA